MAEEESFNIEDIEDIRVIIRAKGKNYSVTPKEGKDAKECKEMRIAFFGILLDSHAVVTPSLEQIHKIRTEKDKK